MTFLETCCLCGASTEKIGDAMLCPDHGFVTQEVCDTILGEGWEEDEE